VILLDDVGRSGRREGLENAETLVEHLKLGWAQTSRGQVAEESLYGERLTLAPKPTENVLYDLEVKRGFRRTIAESHQIANVADCELGVFEQKWADFDLTTNFACKILVKLLHLLVIAPRY
jgi:hypothetical protein